jgi:hypothetical protein
MANPNQSRYSQDPRKGYDSNGRRLSDGAKKITGVRSAGSKYADLAGEMEDAGVKIKGGQITPTEKFGTMAGLASEQRNPLSRGSRAGSISTLGQPMNSMYAANPDFFRSQIAQRNAPATAESVGAQRAGIQAPAATVSAPTPSEILPTSKGFDASLVEKRGFPGGRTSPTFGSQGLPDDTPSAASSAARGMAFKGATTGTPSGASVAPAPQSQMDLNRQALEQGAAGIRLRREALGQSGPADSRTLPSSRVAKTETGYKVVTDAKGNIVGTNAPIKPISSAVGNFADQRAAFNRGEGTAAEKSALGPNIREAALAELSKSVPKVSPAQSRAQIQASSPMGPPLQGSAQMGPPLQGSAQMGPPLQGSAQMGPPRYEQMGPPTQGGNIGRIAPSGGVPKMFESAPSLAGPPSNMARPIQGPPNASATTPYERMQQTTLGPATPNGPPLSTSKPPSMMSAPPTKDDIRKQRTTLARR